MDVTLTVCSTCSNMTNGFRFFVVLVAYPDEMFWLIKTQIPNFQLEERTTNVDCKLLLRLCCGSTDHETLTPRFILSQALNMKQTTIYSLYCLVLRQMFSDSQSSTPARWQIFFPHQGVELDMIQFEVFISFLLLIVLPQNHPDRSHSVRK